MASFTACQGIVYITTNNINNKIYIGQSTKNQKSYIGSGTFLKKAIKKYGKKNFTKEILIDNVSSIKELNSWEAFYINLFNSRNIEIGYNLVPGGNQQGGSHTKEAIEKIKIRSNLEDNKLLIRKIQKIASIALIGTHKSKEEKLRMLKSKFGKNRIIEIYNSNNTLLHFCNFSKEAEEFTKVKKSSIRNNLCGLSKSAGGYFFKYKNII